MPKRSRSLALLVLLDVILINAAFALGYYVRYQLQLFRSVGEAFSAPYSAYLPFQFWFTVLMLFFLAVDGVYAPRRGGSWFEQLYQIANATTTVGVILFAAVFFILPPVYSRGLIIEAVVITIAFLGGVRLVWRGVQAYRRKRGAADRVLIVGAGEMGRAVMRTLVARPELGYRVVGFVDDNPAKGDLGRFKALGGLDGVEALLKAERVEEVIITLPWMYHREIIGLVRACEAQGVRARVVPDFFQLSLNRVDFDDIGGIPLIGIKEADIPRVGRVVKRALDLLLSSTGLLVF
ncbi:MAG: nucleoside-diphosphate sugar epimerase/dehydratase, partial [Anaerolineales bacterium]